MFIPNQPQFKLRVHTKQKIHLDTLKGHPIAMSSDEDYIDIESCVAYPVTYEETADLLTTLSFTVDKHADVLLYYFKIGQNVTLYGGHYADDAKEMRKVFSGTVTRIQTQFSENGYITFSVECMNYALTTMGKDAFNFVYPDKKSTRKFARKDQLKLIDIVEGIAKENKYELGVVDLPPEAGTKVFDKKNIRYQKDVTDWKFLTELAADFGCSIWFTMNEGVEKLNIASTKKLAQKKDGDISFLYPLYNTTNQNLTNWDNKIKDNEWQRYKYPQYDRPRILRDVSVEEDVSMAYACSRSATYFDESTGEYKEAVAIQQTDKDGNSYTVFYELDEAKVEHIENTRKDIADKIRENGPTSLEWGTPPDNNPNHASYYYKQIKRYNGNRAVFDKAFFGITLTATCNQDLDIRSQKPYSVRGILSYHSTNMETMFFLRGLKHIWSNDGTWTELDFIR